jgi:hypothetical protein
MNLQDFRQMRMHTQRLVGEPFASPAAMVGWHLAVQAQDWAGTKWGIGQRCAVIADADLDRLLNNGALLRTHVLRPTWHLVLPEDIRWLLALTGPRVEAGNAGRYRQLGLDPATLARGCEVLAQSLEDGAFLTRAELAERLEAAGIATAGQRLPHLQMHAELAGVICSGPRRGKQFTYALLEDRVPPAPEKERDAAVAELARRYLASHGPATPHDMAWWSGLTVTDCRQGIGMLGDEVASVELDGTTWWYCPPASPTTLAAPVVHLLPAFDEYFIGFRQHQVAWDPEVRDRYNATRELWAANLVALDGRIVGGWRRSVTARQVSISTTAPLDLGAAQRDAFVATAEAYGRFLGLPVTIDSAPAIAERQLRRR